MAKSRKTRHQKEVADLRRQESPVVSSSVLNEYRPSSPLPPRTSTHTTVIQTSEYKFVQKDLVKTLSITGAIIIAELVLFFFVMR